jgi:DNA ligase (NAD+)
MNLNNLTLDQKKKLYKKAKAVYYNSKTGETLLSDREFDLLEDSIKEEDPSWSGLKSAGATIGRKTKVKLPIAIFSLDKTKAHNVDQWLANQDGDIVVSDKLDGASLELVYQGGIPRKCYTRGNGTIGGDVSFLIPHLKIPQKVGTADFILRCEGLFAKAAFLKYKAEFDSARNAASGILNRRDAHHSIKDLHLMVIQVMQPNVKPSRGLAWAKSKGFRVVPFKVFNAKKLNAKNLSALLAKRKTGSSYALDGIVLTLDKVNPLPKAGNPTWAVAFKENIDVDAAPVTTVRAVEWEISAHGLVKPVIVYDPVDWDGSSLTRASAFNAKFVNTNGIGVGAKVAILRSGDIIPYIVKVLKKVKPSVPPASMGNVHLDKKGTDWVLDAPLENEDYRIKKIARTFNNLGVEFLKETTVRKLYAHGYTNVTKILKASVQDFLKLPGVKVTTAEKLWSAIHSVIDKGVPLINLMDASGVFPRGIGTTRLENIAQVYPLMKLAAAPEDVQMKKLLALPGFKDTTAQMFIKGSKKFLKWMDIVGIKAIDQRKATNESDIKSSKLTGITVSWTSYRNKDEERTVQENGGKVVPFGGRTQVLLFSPTGKLSTKIDKAKAKGIAVMTWDQFAKKYKL